MGRKNATTADDSLDLLLDTICNAFGGILFISLLILILISLTVKNVETPPDPALAVEIAAAKLRLAELRSQAQMTRANQEMLNDIQQRLVDPKSKALAGRLQNALQKTNALSDQQNSALDKLTVLHEEETELIEQIRQREQDIKLKSGKLAQTNQQLEQQLSQRTQVVTAPKNKMTSKSCCILVVKNQHDFDQSDRKKC